MFVCRLGTPTAQTASLELESYSNKHTRIGLCVIINNKNFNKLLTGQGNRDGTDVDAKALENVFMHLGFDVTRYDDLSKTDMSINLRQGELILSPFTTGLWLAQRSYSITASPRFPVLMTFECLSLIYLVSLLVFVMLYTYIMINK